MAKVKILVDTDIIIDCLKGVKSARDLFRSDAVDIYCSILSRKELLSMPVRAPVGRPLRKSDLKHSSALHPVAIGDCLLPIPHQAGRQHPVYPVNPV